MRCFPVRPAITSGLAAGLLVLAGGCYQMNGYVLNRSGQTYYEQGQYALAAAEFEQAALSDPTNPDYLANLARTRMKMGDLQGAEQIYRRVLSTSPSHQPAYHGMSEVLLAQGRSPEAVGLLQTWAETQPYVAEAHVELAWLQRQMGQPDAAAQSLQNALQVNPAHTTALAHLGQYYQERGQPEQAVALYQSSLRADWNQPDVHSRLAHAAQQAGSRHPMSATAMARGVHPWDVPRTQAAFGRPSSGPQMAQWPMPPSYAQATPWAVTSPPSAAHPSGTAVTSSVPTSAVPWDPSGAAWHQVTDMSLTSNAPSAGTPAAEQPLTVPVPSPDPEFTQNPLPVPPAAAPVSSADAQPVPMSWATSQSTAPIRTADDVQLTQQDVTTASPANADARPVVEAF